MRGITELGAGEDGQFLTEKDRLINADRDIRNDSTLALAGPRGSTASLGSNAVVSQSGRAASGRSSRPQAPAKSESPEERQKRVYANYEYLLEKENSKSKYREQQKEIV